MTLLKRLLFGILIGLAFPVAVAHAAVDVTATELQAAGDILTPSSTALGHLEGYSSFYPKSRVSVSGGIQIRYQALLLADPWLSSELPELQIVAYAYSNQDAATQSFNSLLNSSRLDSGDLTLLSWDSHAFVYEAEEGGDGVDFFGTVDAEYRSFHRVERSGNVILQVSVFRTSGLADSNNVMAYQKATSSVSTLSTLLKDASDQVKLSLGLLFPPNSAFFVGKTEASSLNLSEAYALPSNGSLTVNVYISDPKGAEGTVLDSAGLNSPIAGDLYLYITDSGTLYAGLYAPAYDSDCPQEAGWYRLSSETPLYPYEWNKLTLEFGVGGFGLLHNGKELDHCSVSQARSTNPVYLGDFPDDALSEGFIGQVGSVSIGFGTTDSGKHWDDVLTEQLFFDLPNSDPDLAIFEFLKEKEVFTGSDGMLKPDAVLNRAAMTKIILRAFDKGFSTKAGQPFWDVAADAWYQKYALKAYEIGMIQGNPDGSFAAAASITRAEFFTMLARVSKETSLTYDGFYTDVAKADWYANGAAYAHEHGLVDTALFDPSATLTRREAGQILYSLIAP